MNDSENPIPLAPADYLNDEFMGYDNKVLGMSNWLNNEQREKYHSRYNLKRLAELHFQALPGCFNKCVGEDMSLPLDAFEKNCVRECYFKKVSSRDDINILLQ